MGGKNSGRKKMFNGIVAKMTTFRIFPWEKTIIKKIIQEDRKKRQELIKIQGESIIKDWTKNKIV